MPKASDLFVAGLEDGGVEYVFGVPGEENLDLIESLRTSKIRLVPTRHEQAAGFMAATVGRLTGGAGVCLATLGPGATNLVTAAAYAQLGANVDVRCEIDRLYTPVVNAAWAQETLAAIEKVQA